MPWPFTTPLHSLKSQLLIWLLVPLAVILPARAWFQYQLTVEQSNTAFDQSLANTATAFATLIRVEEGGVYLEISEETERLLRTDQVDIIYYAVTGPQGRVLSGDGALARLSWPANRQEVDFANLSLHGELVRAVLREVRCGVGPCEVRVAETLRKRQEIEARALVGTVRFMLLLAVILFIAIWWSVARVLHPLRALSVQVSHRSLQDLSPLDVGSVPSEVHPFVAAINQLFGRLERGARDQQAFLADAAHQLRTPLTALRTEAELALLEPHPPALQPTLTRMHRSAERASRLASQLLAQARVEAGDQAQRMQRMDLRDVANAAAQEWVPHPLAEGVDLGFQLDSAPIHGDRHLLQELLSNLIHNALLYARQADKDRDTGMGTSADINADAGILKVTVRSRQVRLDGHLYSELVVEDNGPGIPLGEREAVLERFHRGSQARGEGSGLGLAIVRDIALAHHAQLRLEDGPEGRGLAISVRFPAAS